MLQSTATLTLTIIQDTTDVTEDKPDLIKRHLEALVWTLANNGDLSGFTDLLVDDYDYNVSVIENNQLTTVTINV